MIVFQALTIAFTSQVIQKLTYYFDNGKSLEGYIEYVHSYFAVEHFDSCEAPNIDQADDPFGDITVTHCW